jgi:NAD(P)-dependent dehydrogenase (short-subunit alcohol dehydrogenase family)
VRLVEVSGGRAVAVQADVRPQEQLESAVATEVERFGAIDVCVANAGIVAHGDFWTLTEQEWGQVIDVETGLKDSSMVKPGRGRKPQIPAGAGYPAISYRTRRSW